MGFNSGFKGLSWFYLQGCVYNKKEMCLSNRPGWRNICTSGLTELEGGYFWSLTDRLKLSKFVTERWFVTLFGVTTR